MAVTTNYNVRLDDTPLVWQPSRVVPHPPKGHDVQAVHGDWLGFVRAKGWWFELEFGQELSHDDLATQLQTIKDANTTGIYELSFVWFDGDTHTFNVLWDEELSAAIHWGSVLEKFSIVLYEVYA